MHKISVPPNRSRLARLVVSVEKSWWFRLLRLLEVLVFLTALVLFFWEYEKRQQSRALEKATLLLAIEQAHRDALESNDGRLAGGIRSALEYLTAEAVPLARLTVPQTDLSEARLAGAVLAGATLAGSDLSGADLSSTNLRGADLSEASLRFADLRGANLSHADLSDADLFSVCTDEHTIWPDDFGPPKSADETCRLHEVLGYK